MPTARVFRTSTFRLALLYVLLFTASVMLLLGFIYWTTVRVIERQTNATIEAEIRGLAEQYRERGLSRLVDVIKERSGPYGDPDSVYLLTERTYRPLSGNLSAWPREARDRFGDWVQISAARAEEPGVPRDIRARTFQLPGTFYLLVGRDARGLTDFEGVIFESLGWALALTLGLGLAGGIVMSRNMLRRVEAVRETSLRIVRGDLTRRMPVTNIGDEFDRLSSTVNEMLDEIEKLMTGLRTVTDSVAHDLRSPLTRLKSRMELALLEDTRDQAGYRRALKRAIAETDGILRTFNLLMEIARAEAGTSQIAMERVELAAVVADIVDLYRPLAEERAITIDAALDPEVRVTGHAQFLSQLTANLVDNAIKYTPDGGRIRVSLEDGGGEDSGGEDGGGDAGRGAVLCVDDSGPGIAPSDRERVLQRFVRLDSSRTTPGSGLGLSLVAGVASFHQAALTLEQSALGGLRVRLVFPGADPSISD